jgi:hypothetical protein
MEIPQITITLDDKYLGWNLFIVPEKFKSRIMVDKKFRNREYLGIIEIGLNDSIIDDDGITNNDNNDDEYDDAEQIFIKDRSKCKYTYLYGTKDFQIIKIFQLKELQNTLLIEIPAFRNYLTYNVLSVKLLSTLVPAKIYLLVEETENTSAISDQVEKSNKFKDDLITGRYIGGNGERGLDGIVAAIINRTNGDNADINTNIEFYCVEQASKGTLYL